MSGNSRLRCVGSGQSVICLSSRSNSRQGVGPDDCGEYFAAICLQRQRISACRITGYATGIARLESGVPDQCIDGEQPSIFDLASDPRPSATVEVDSPAYDQALKLQD